MGGFFVFFFVLDVVVNVQLTRAIKRKLYRMINTAVFVNAMCLYMQLIDNASFRTHGFIFHSNHFRCLHIILIIIIIIKKVCVFFCKIFYFIANIAEFIGSAIILFTTTYTSYNLKCTINNIENGVCLIYLLEIIIGNWC